MSSFFKRLQCQVWRYCVIVSLERGFFERKRRGTSRDALPSAAIACKGMHNNVFQHWSESMPIRQNGLHRYRLSFDALEQKLSPINLSLNGLILAQSIRIQVSASQNGGPLPAVEPPIQIQGNGPLILNPSLPRSGPAGPGS